MEHLMKKQITTLLAIATVITLAGCSGGSTETTETTAAAPVETSTVVAESTSEVSDTEVETWAKSVVGGNANDDWGAMAAASKVPDWGYAVNRVYYGKGGNIVFNMQLDRVNDKAVAESIAKLYANSIRLSDENPEWAENASFIIVENGASEHMTQEKI